MLCRSYCASCIGVEAITVTVEVAISQGINFYLVGLPDNAVRESQQRISSALESVGGRIPGKRVTINLAPADIRKEGSSFDLPIAIAILAASQQYKFENLANYIIMGELALDGSLREVNGALAVALHAQRDSFLGCIFPLESAYQACEADQIEVYGAQNLREVISILLGEGKIEPLKPKLESHHHKREEELVDFAHIKGQEYVKRGLEIAATGRHNILMCGTPGSGKSLMAKAFSGIMPLLSREEAIESAVIYSVAGKKRGSANSLNRVAPFRAPHYSASAMAIVGGGVKGSPGEISLAHNGVLYLDELPEFSPKLLEMLRGPLEERVVALSRVRYQIEYPSNFLLVASMNPCPCGYYGTEGERCSCMPYTIERYRKRVSTPLLDRIDLHLSVLPVEHHHLLSERVADSTQTILERVLGGRAIQKSRFKREGYYNSEMSPSELREFCPLDREGRGLIESAIQKLGLSARGYSKVLKVARTIADLEGSKSIKRVHLAEAIQYRAER